MIGAVAGRARGAACRPGPPRGRVRHATTRDSRHQSALGLALENIGYRPPDLHFELPSGAERAIFDGRVAADKASGAFKQSGVKGSSLYFSPP
jgi:hypothetical protein